MNLKDYYRWNGYLVRTTDCPLCRSEQYDLLFTKHDFSYVKCDSCGLVYVREQLHPDEVNKIYAKGYQSKLITKADPTDYSSYQYLLRKLSRYRRNNLLLDVGCFTGKFLYGARSEGWGVEGVEISEQAVEFCRTELGLERVFCTTLEDAAQLQVGYDVITMIDVIEHFQRPFDAVKVAFGLLRPGGVLYIETPNYNSLARVLYGSNWRVFFPWHFSYFTPDTLGKLLRDVGFDDIYLYTSQIGPLSSFDPYESLKKGSGISDTRSASSRVKQFGFVRRHYRFFKDMFIMSRRIESLSFRVLNRFGIKIGGRLVAYASR